MLAQEKERNGGGGSKAGEENKLPREKKLYFQLEFIFYSVKSCEIIHSRD